MPRSIAIAATCFFVVLAFARMGNAQKKSTEEILARADSSSPADCARFCMDAAKRLVDEGSQQISDGNTASGLKTISDAIRYAEKSSQGALSAHKRLKDTEIGLRELIRRLASIKQVVEADQRPLVDDDIASLEKLRDELLATMFGNPKNVLEHKR